MLRAAIISACSASVVWTAAGACAQTTNQMYMDQPQPAAARNPWVEQLRTELEDCPSFGQKRSAEADMLASSFSAQRTPGFARRNAAAAAIDQNTNGQFDTLLASSISAYDSNTHQFAPLAQGASTVYLTLEFNRAGYPTAVTTDMQPESLKAYIDKLVQALKACSPYNLPLERYDEWKTLGMDFRVPAT